MPFFGAEWAWNSVDVRGDDGLLHNGRVIDALDGGLVVDFRGTGQSEPRLIPFADVYYRWFPTPFDSGKTERSVEVLLRLDAKDPWKWHPGVQLHDFGLVRVSVADRELTGIVERHRVRDRSTKAHLDRLRFKKGQFLKKLVLVPSELGDLLASDEQLIAIFNAFCQQCGYWMMATQVLRDPHHGATKELAILETDKQSCWPQYWGGRTCPEPLDKVLVSLLKRAATAVESNGFLCPAVSRCDGHIQSLYRDPTIFPQIFECLTTLQQSKLRAVCGQWNAVLTSAYIRSVVTVSTPNDDAELKLINQYRFASCLYHSWTPHTRMLVLYGGSAPHACEGAQLLAIARLLGCIMAEHGRPVVYMVLLPGEWKLRCRGANWVNAFWQVLESVASVCRQIVLKDVRVNIDLDWSKRYDAERIAIRFSNHRITRQLTLSDFWAILNNGMRDVDMERLAEWIGSWPPPRSVRCKIAQILNLTQTLDPRAGVRYSGMSFYPYGTDSLDGVDIGHLTTFTRHALLQRFVGESSRIVFHIH